MHLGLRCAIWSRLVSIQIWTIQNLIGCRGVTKVLKIGFDQSDVTRVGQKSLKHFETMICKTPTIKWSLAYFQGLCYKRNTWAWSWSLWTEASILRSFLKENNLKGFIGNKLYQKYSNLSIWLWNLFKTIKN